MLDYHDLLPADKPQLFGIGLIFSPHPGYYSGFAACYLIDAQMKFLLRLMYQIIIEMKVSLEHEVLFPLCFILKINILSSFMYCRYLQFLFFIQKFKVAHLMYNQF